MQSQSNHHNIILWYTNDVILFEYAATPIIL
jgi:hypothetical protein